MVGFSIWFSSFFGPANLTASGELEYNILGNTIGGGGRLGVGFDLGNYVHLRLCSFGIDVDHLNGTGPDAKLSSGIEWHY